ncbi:hypothetical protein AGABI2DRAFT_123036 [Agaricus bisporus var. bisporus H97]|uniref:hypothetical protein n=1 Tax=Agaricus bisporus var. bisporus (strain H97 / ATCC MYA-4626 / FGSC 10389) TaxID=936046 RepID=UPI00029F7BD1|nr:hypothetical protein AGABI2DRAFT_123036 [Agaricus bisporus var. bisporus H97]EKV42313.1 hypothetical protein AGABI2DRAFT_123036 [Agaricus bisporus var. bisporus H97]
MPTTVLWPSGLPRKSGFIYGWKTPAYCVAGLLDADTELSAATALDRACIAPAWHALQDSCGGKPQVLGYCEYNTSNDEYTFASWKTQPVLILYHRHPLNSLRFYAFDTSVFVSITAVNGPSEAFARLFTHDFTRPTRPQIRNALDQVTLNQFNASKLLEATISDSSARMMPAIAAVLFSISALTTLLCRPIHTLSRLVSAVANVPITPSSTLGDLSAIVQQVAVRAEQSKYFVNEIPHLRNRGESDITNYAVRYTHFFNTIWMILNDVTIGMAFGSYLTENSSRLAEVVNNLLRMYLVHNVIFTLHWLDSWPAGLKLNTELSRFYSHMFTGFMRLWLGGLFIVMPYSADVIHLLGILSTCGGLSLVISAIMDVVAICTAHIYACYFFTGLIYHRMLKTAGSLFNLFRGKRYNVLRNRVDSWEYDMDQLLFGTILFTLLAFLFPTVLVYYAFFATIRFAILLLLACMEFLLALVNHFPLFSLMLSVKDPWRIPGGIIFLKTEPKSQSVMSSHASLTIENQAVPLSLLFSKYVRLSGVLARHYNPLRLTWCLLKGEHLNAIPRHEIRDSTPNQGISSPLS